MRSTVASDVHFAFRAEGRSRRALEERMEAFGWRRVGVSPLARVHSHRCVAFTSPGGLLEAMYDTPEEDPESVDPVSVLDADDASPAAAVLVRLCFATGSTHVVSAQRPTSRPRWTVRLLGELLETRPSADDVARAFRTQTPYAGHDPVPDHYAPLVVDFIQAATG